MSCLCLSSTMSKEAQQIPWKSQLVKGLLISVFSLKLRIVEDKITFAKLTTLLQRLYFTGLVIKGKRAFQG